MSAAAMKPIPIDEARKLILDSLGIDPDWNGVDTWFESRKRSSKPAKNQNIKNSEGNPLPSSS